MTEQQLRKLGMRLKSLRKEKGFSNYKMFAYQNNIARAQYGRYENGSDLRFSTLMKIIEALDMNVEDFFSQGFDKNQ